MPGRKLVPFLCSFHHDEANFEAFVKANFFSLCYCLFSPRGAYRYLYVEAEEKLEDEGFEDAGFDPTFEVMDLSSDPSPVTSSSVHIPPTSLKAFAEACTVKGVQHSQALCS